MAMPFSIIRLIDAISSSLAETPGSFLHLALCLHDGAGRRLPALLEKDMRYPAEVFGITIPSNEIAYIAEILLPYTAM